MIAEPSAKARFPSGECCHAATLPRAEGRNLSSSSDDTKGADGIGPFDFSDFMVVGAGFESATFGL
jgi:hypothetical protein